MIKTLYIITILFCSSFSWCTSIGMSEVIFKEGHPKLAMLFLLTGLITTFSCLRLVGKYVEEMK